MTNDEILSKTINYLRFPLSVGIVFIHFSITGGITIDGKTYGAENSEWFFFIVNFISQTLARIGVPLFFLFSGFLFFYNKVFNIGVYKQKLRSRAMTLLIPYILWNTIALIWQLKCFIPGISSFYHPVEIHFSLMRFFHTYFCNTYHSGIILGPPYYPDDRFYPIDLPLWFVRDLMVMVAISPIIYWVVKRRGILPVMFLGILWLFSTLAIPRGIGYLNQLVTAAFFFSWGAYYSLFNRNFVLSFRNFRYSPIFYIITALLDALTKGQVYNDYFHKIGILLGIVSVVVMVSCLIEYEKVRVNKTLANSSFFIFALHFLFINELGKILFVLFGMPDDPYAMLALYIVVPILTTLICLGLYVLLKNYLPKICYLLTGGR